MLAWRDQMLTRGWYAWAPCVHQKNCPLLKHSAKDWCHHRIHWKQPEWFSNMEELLPMRNHTLTFSYLLLSRDKPQALHPSLSRVIGDEQEERGKSRQLICRGENREFLSWLHRDMISPKLKRGDLIKLEKVEEKHLELRLLSSTGYTKVSSDS
jgi:hypothetical protein